MDIHSDKVMIKFGIDIDDDIRFIVTFSGEDNFRVVEGDSILEGSIINFDGMLL